MTSSNVSSKKLPATTRVIACRPGGATVLEERPMPLPGNNELLMRVTCCGLCGTDLFKLANDTAPFGEVLGHELVGEVVSRGDNVRDFSLGDRIVVPHHVACGKCALCRRGNETLCTVFRENLLAPGGFSDYVLVRERAVRLAARRIPNHVSDSAAVFLEPAACVLRGLRNSGLANTPPDLTPSGCVVVLGAGSMGLLHVLVLRAWRPDIHVVACDPVEERRQKALELGAQTACEPEAARAIVDQASSALGADALFDTVGGQKVLDFGLGLTREGGTVVLFAHAPTGDIANFDLNSLFKYERRVIGTYSGGLVDQHEIFDQICTGRLDASPLVTHELPLTEFAHGVDLVRDREALKVLFSADVETRP